MTKSASSATKSYDDALYTKFASQIFIVRLLPLVRRIKGHYSHF